MSDEETGQFMRTMTLRNFWVSIAAVTVPLLITGLGGVITFGTRQSAAESRTVAAENRIAAVEQRQARQDADAERKAQTDSETNIRLARLEEKVDALREALKEGKGR